MNEPSKGATSYQLSVNGVELDTQVVRPSFGAQLWALRRIIVCILTPIVFIWLPFIDDRPLWRCAYLIAIMATFWITEVVPIAVTSLIPIFLCPMMGILKAKETSAQYMTDTSMLFLGGLVIAIAIETWNLHKRMALAVLMLFGSDPKWLMAGLMLVTWFLSMWISNTATTAMMLPISQAILQQLKDGKAEDDEAEEDENFKSKKGMENKGYSREMDDMSNNHTTDNDKQVVAVSPEKSSEVQCSIMPNFPSQDQEKEKAADDAQYLKMCKALSLCIAYSANTGGIASLTGTGPNIVLKGQSDIVFDEHGVANPITFATWMIYGLPLSFIVLIILWIWLQLVFLPWRELCFCCSKKKDKAATEKVKKVIRNAYKALGPISFAQKIIMILFVVLVTLWITRDLGGTGGWGDIFEKKYVSDSTPALFIGFFLFVIPSSLPNIFCFRKDYDESKCKIIPILNWKNVHEKMPWSLYLLLGGGFALAKAATKTGLSKEVGEMLLVFKDLNPWLMLLILCYIITFFTEVTSNTAIATLMMPILAELAKALNVNPLFFMFPAALTTSFAFMLPAATPPNAIVFSYGQVRVIDMAMCGFFMNLLTVPILVGATASWGNAFFHFDTLPDGFNINVTTTAATTAAMMSATTTN